MPSAGTKRKVGLDQVPCAVKRAILREARGQKVSKVEEVTNAYGRTYEAGWVVDGMEVELTVTSEGRLLCEKMEPAYDGGWSDCN